MEEENKIVAEEEVASEPTVSEEETNETRGNEPHGSVSASRPGDRKYGNHKGRPSERRGGRGGFRKNTDDLQERVVAINRISKIRMTHRKYFSSSHIISPHNLLRT